MFLRTISETEAEGRIAQLYEEERRDIGLVMSATRAWTVRPDLLPLFSTFFDGVKARFTLSERDWRLITFVASVEVPSTYCTTVYGKRLLAELGSRKAVAALRRDVRQAGLPDRDVAMLFFAQKIAHAAHEVTQADIDALRDFGFTDPQIGDIALCASLRCFMSRFFEATGAGPEAQFVDGDPELRSALTVGRPLPSAP